MAMVKCPECGRDVSDRAAACPTCGFPIASSFSNVIKIKLDPGNINTGLDVRIFDARTNKLIVASRTGSVVDLKSDKPLKIYFAMFNDKPQFTTTVEPGKKYCTTLRPGVWSAKIVGCSEVEVIDS